MKKALLAVSFGTSYENTRKKTIDKIEEDLANYFTDYELRRAFTSQMIINKLKKRDKLYIDNPREALEKLVEEGFEEVLVQTTHIINGSEFHKLYETLQEFKDKFKTIKLGMPLLTSVEDYEKVADAMAKYFAGSEDKIIILMGHGSEHFSNSAYPAMDYVFKNRGYKNVYLATVEGYPPLESIIDEISNLPTKEILLMPFMIVAGDHIQNDLIGDEEDSWKNILISKGYNVDSLIIGMGEMEEIRKIFIEHAENAEIIA